MAGIAQQLTALPVTDSLKHSSLPASFTKLPWAETSGTWSATNGWSPPGYSASWAKPGSRGGIYHNIATLAGGSAAVGVTKTTGTLSASRQFAVWLFTEGEEASGYQLAVIAESATKVKFVLRKWVAGVETLLAEVKGIAFGVGDSFYLAALEGKVSMWHRVGESVPVRIGEEVADTTFTEGYAGIDGNGSNPRLINFTAYALRPETRQRHKPPLALDVEVETPNGTFRLAADAKDPKKRPRGLSFSTQRGDGFGPASCSLSREIFRDYPDIALLDTWRFVGRQGDVAYEGKLHSSPRTNDPAQEVNVSLVGWMTYLKNRKIAPLFIDSRLSSWGEPSVQRRADLTALKVKPGPSVSEGWQGTGESPPGIVIDFTNWTAVKGYTQRGEAWFYGGGEKLGKLLYHLAVVTGPEGDATWLDITHLADDDTASGYESGPDHNATTNSNAYETVEATTGTREYAVFVSEYTNAGGGFSMTDTHVWELPKVVGNQGLEISGAWPEVGPKLSDVLQSVLSYYPKIEWAGETNSFILQQATWHDAPEYGYEIAQTLNNLVLWETSVWEDRKFYFHPADLTRFDWQLRTDDPGTTVVFQGDSIENFANGCSVSFTDFAGIRRVLWPDDHAELRDDSENNPANIHDEQLWTDCEVPTPCSEAEALQYGRTYLAEYNRPKRPGTFRIAGGYIKDSAGHWQQGWKVRSSQTLGVMNNVAEDQPRLIFATSWNQDSKTLEITVDAPPKYLDAIVARQGLSRTARGHA